MRVYYSICCLRRRYEFGHTIPVVPGISPLPGGWRGGGGGG